MWWTPPFTAHSLQNSSVRLTRKNRTQLSLTIGWHLRRCRSPSSGMLAHVGKREAAPLVARLDHRAADHGRVQGHTEKRGNASDASDAPSDLGVDRTRFAYDRTLLAWVRTATSLIAFGFAIQQFFWMARAGAPESKGIIGPHGFGLTMIVRSSGIAAGNVGSSVAHAGPTSAVPCKGVVLVTSKSARCACGVSRVARVDLDDLSGLASMLTRGGASIQGRAFKKGAALWYAGHRARRQVAAPIASGSCGLCLQHCDPCGRKEVVVRGVRTTAAAQPRPRRTAPYALHNCTARPGVCTDTSPSKSV
jgi:Domain of unknown function (DUF202)